MSNFQVNDIIKEYVACNINKIIFIENYGLITNIQDNNVTTLWGDENKIINLQQNWYMCKKITDNEIIVSFEKILFFKFLEIFII